MHAKTKPFCEVSKLIFLREKIDKKICAYFCDCVKYKQLCNDYLQWEKLEMSRGEVRRLLCAVAFHAIAALCVAWSLYVLVERSIEEARHGFVDWSFWTKLIVVIIGSTGGLVFMYIQCKAYMTLCRKWRAFNRYVT